ncbi:hypothetical protein [Streptomyces sp. NPDC048659]|uniref:hypothetical protein n=1 Tax=Streptomyces sp. NPDC048659 TaxID=3155489 RepID=UPI0034203628
MPRISADQRIPALLDAVRGGRLPARLAPGGPPAGLGVGRGPDGLLVTGGPRTWRLTGAAGTRLGAVLAGRTPDLAEAELLHALGLWEHHVPALTAAQHGAFADPAVRDAALRFCGRWAATTRHHPGGAAALSAWRGIRPVVVGHSVLARAITHALTHTWPTPPPGATTAPAGPPPPGCGTRAASVGTGDAGAARPGPVLAGEPLRHPAVLRAVPTGAGSPGAAAGAAASGACGGPRAAVHGEHGPTRPLHRGAEPAPRRPAGEPAVGAPELRELVLVVDQEADPLEARPQLLVRGFGESVRIGPWTEPGETPCPGCVAREPAVPPRPVTGDLELLAALAVAEAVHTSAGLGRGARPGLVVEHTPATGTTRALGTGPTPDCAHCAGRPARPGRARAAAEALPALLLGAAPPRRWRAPAAEEVHYSEAAVGLQHAALPGEPLTPGLTALPSEPCWTEFLVRVAGRRSVAPAVDRWAPSAGNLGAGALLVPGREGLLLVQPCPDTDDPSALRAARVPVGPSGDGFGLAVDVGRLVDKYGGSGARIAAAEAGALLAQAITAAAASGLRARAVSGPPTILPPGFQAYGGLRITSGHPRDPRAEAALWARRSRRDLRWSPAADRVALRRALGQARSQARAARIDTSGIRLTLLPPGTADDVLMQPGLPGRAAVLLAHTDLTVRGGPDVVRDAAALLALTALAGGPDGLHSCLVHGLVPVVAAARLGGGLIDRAALIGLLVGHGPKDSHA